MRRITAEERAILLEESRSEDDYRQGTARELSLLESLAKRGLVRFRADDVYGRTAERTGRGDLAIQCFAAVNARLA